MKKKEVISNLISFGLVFLLFAIVFYLVPIVHDDWGMIGYPNIIKSFHDSLLLWKTFTGRVLSYTFVYFMMSNLKVKVLCSALIITITVLVIKKIVGSKVVNLLLILGLFFGMSVSIFREAVLWSTGFWFYTIPTLSTIIYLCYLKKMIFDKECNFKIIDYIFCFLLGLLSNFFMENSSLYAAMLSVGSIVVVFFLKKKVYPVQITFLLGSFIGTGLMFASPSYWSEASRMFEDAAFSSLSLFGKIKFTLSKTTFLNNLIFDNYLINLLIAILFLVSFKKENAVYKVSSILFLLCNLFVLGFYNIRSVEMNFKIQFIMACLWSISLIACIFFKYYKKDTPKLLWMSGLLISYYLVAAPLLIVTGFGARCFYHSFIIFLILCLELFNESIKDDTIIFVIVTVITAGIIGFKYYILFDNYNTEVIRRERLQNASIENPDVVLLPSFPHSEYVHADGEIWSEYHYISFKNYYHLSDKTEIVFVNNETGEELLVSRDGGRTTFNK